MQLMAITGSNGKTTTAALTPSYSKNMNLDVGLAGNIGDSFAKSFVAEATHPNYVVEVSSFQLDGTEKFQTTYCHY